MDFCRYARGCCSLPGCTKYLDVKESPVSPGVHMILDDGFVVITASEISSNDNSLCNVSEISNPNIVTQTSDRKYCSSLDNKEVCNPEKSYNFTIFNSGLLKNNKVRFNDVSSRSFFSLAPEEKVKQYCERRILG